MALGKLNISKQRFATITVAFVLMCIVLIFALSSAPDHNEWGHDYLSTNALPYAMMGSFITIWGCFAVNRCTDKVIKRGIRIICFLTCFWLLDQLIKHELPFDDLITITWYLYYLPLLFIPLSCFIMGIRALNPNETSHLRVVRRISEIVTLALFALVITNDLHFQVFLINLDSPIYPDDYVYQWGFIAIYAWIALMLIGFLACIFISSRQNLKRALIVIALPIILCLLYSMGYNLRVPLVAGTNFSLLFIAVAICLLEVCLQLRILPNMNINEKTFRALPFDLTIIDKHENVVFHTDAATLEPKGGSIPSASKQELERKGMAVIRKDNMSYQINKLHGGLSVFAQDISPINRQIQQLESQQQMLRDQSRLLTNQHEIESKLGAQNKKEELFEDIETSLADAVNEIKTLLDTLPSDDTPENHELRKRHLMSIKLLTAYCKRKGRLVVSSREDPSFLGERLQLALSETASDMNSIGITCGTLVEADRPLDIKTVSNFYDRFYDIAHLALKLNEPTIMLHIGNTDTEFQLRVILEEDSLKGESLDENEVERLKTNLAAQGVQYDLQLDGDLLILRTFIKFEEGAASPSEPPVAEMGGVA